MDATEARAKFFIDHGYYQISRRSGTVAKLPDGMTGIEALARYGIGDRADVVEWARDLGEGDAGDYFLRVHASRLGLSIDLDPAVFEAFRRQGGGTYLEKHWSVRLSDDEARQLLRRALDWQLQGARSKWTTKESLALWDEIESLKSKYPDLKNHVR